MHLEVGRFSRWVFSSFCHFFRTVILPGLLDHQRAVFWDPLLFSSDSPPDNRAVPTLLPGMTFERYVVSGINFSVGDPPTIARVEGSLIMNCLNQGPQVGPINL